MSKKENKIIIAKEMIKRESDKNLTYVKDGLVQIETELTNKRISISSAKYNLACLYSIALSSGNIGLNDIDNIAQALSEEEYSKIRAHVGLRSVSLSIKIEEEFKRLFGISEDIHNHLDKDNRPIKKLFGIF